MVEAAADLLWRPRLRVLCLHGRSQTAATFEGQLEKLAGKAASSAEFIFADGPVELPLQHGERENTRGWWADGNDRDPADVGVSSVLEKVWLEQGPFDGVLGFSEGGIAALSYCNRAAAAQALVGEASSGAGDSIVEGRCKDFAGLGLKFVVLVGTPLPKNAKSKYPSLGHFPSLHIFSEGDTIVPASESRSLAALFNAKTRKELVHEGGHAVPPGMDHTRRIATFFEEQRNAIYPADKPSQQVNAEEEEHPMVSEEQREELMILPDVFPEEFVRMAPQWPIRLSLLLPRVGGDTSSTSCLRFELPPGYPSEGCHCRCSLQSDDLGIIAHQRDIIEAAEADRGPEGFVCITSMFQAAQAWVEEHHAKIQEAAASGGARAATKGAEEDEDEEEAESNAWWRHEEGEIDEALLREAEERAVKLLPDMSTATWARACGAGNYGRHWEFVVGLVGKPSAGKSTLFNAATRPNDATREAAMAPHPFTTIDPNVGPGWFAAPCPSSSSSSPPPLLPAAMAEKVKPEHGSAPNGCRRMPLLVKDVAGLVPGAYMGRGRGNAFLNDLCDADSIVHVVDSSGRSDREGVDQTGGAGAAGATSVPAASDPLDEVGWVRREIHLWIFCNLRSKWDTVRKKARMAVSHTAKEAVADRLFGLFTGYHASRQLVTQVYEAAGFSLPQLAKTMMDFTEYDLHLLVACFLRARFPIVVALNKVDVPEAVPRVEAARKVLGDNCVPVCARHEWWLYDNQRKGHLTYKDGAGVESVKISDSAPANVKEQWKTIQPTLKHFGSTGVLEVLSRAVLKRRPVFVCPTVDFTTLEPMRKHEATGASAPLSAMILLRPLSTVEEAFSALKREQYLRGDFVRAEVLQDYASKSTRVMKREDVLGKDSAETGRPVILKVLTNKKSR